MNVRIDADLADSIIRLNSLLDSMWGIAKKALLGAAAVAVMAAMVAVRLGPLVSQQPLGFALLALLVLAVGFLAGYGVAVLRYRGRIDAQIRLRDERIGKLEESAKVDAKRIEELEGRVKELTKVADADARAAREIAERRAAMARRLMGLPDDMMHFVWVARLDGRLSTDHRDEAAVALSGRGVLVDVSGSKGFTTKWVLSDDAEAAMDDTEVSDAVRAGHGRWEEKLAEKRLDERERAFRDLSMEQRLFAYRVWRDGSFDFDEYESRDFDSGFLEREDIGGGRFRFRLTPESVELFSEREGSCFATVIEEIERARAAEGR